MRWLRAMDRHLGGRWPLIAAVMALLVAALGCTPAEQDRFVGPGEPRVSPSGDHTATVEERADEHGVPSWTVVITEASGTEVFRDDEAYSAGRNHGVGVIWLSDRDQLWILSSDIGRAHVERDASGSWTKTAITPQTRDSIPQEIADLQ
jgi:hypothetical protein